ncbi:hypothetical protein RZS08_60820, partial [Arthrospira platensis SPKY1]|nr:hypothetical protein [Arthrospira platensis SPKY1]
HIQHLQGQLPYLEKAMLSVPDMKAEWFKELSAIKAQLKQVNEALNGDPILVRYEAQGRTSLKDKVNLMTQALWSTTSGPTGTFERAYKEAYDGFAPIMK